MLSRGYRQVGGNVHSEMECRWFREGGGDWGGGLKIHRGRQEASVTFDFKESH